MARQKEFNIDVALDRALDTFWCKGYAATSVQDLLDDMGLNRGSLYDTFGDKYTLFLAALDRYQRAGSADLIAALNAPGSPRAAIRRTLEIMVDEALDDPRRRGCMMVNTIIELAPHDPEVARRAAAALETMEAAFGDAIRRAIQVGELPADADAEGLAHFLASTVLGLRVLAKVTPTRSALMPVVASALAALG